MTRSGAETAVTLGEIQSLVREKLDRVEERFREGLGSEVGVLEQAIREAGGGGGKRIRPLLLLLTSGLLGHRGEDDVLYACVIEFIHTATLIHDDVIDEAQLRRGRPTMNARYDNTMTVLAGDYVYTKAMHLALVKGDPAVLRILTDRVMRMVEGQILEDRKRGCLETSEAEALEINRRKTACLFGACCRVAAHICGVRGERAEALERYGLELGMAFQLVDDLLDYVADERVLGKPVLSDLREGRLTVPGIYLRDSGPDARDLVRRALRNGRGEELPKRDILGMARERGAISRTYERALGYADGAPAWLDGFPDGPFRQALVDLPGYVLVRNC